MSSLPLYSLFDIKTRYRNEHNTKKNNCDIVCRVIISLLKCTNYENIFFFIISPSFILTECSHFYAYPYPMEVVFHKIPHPFFSKKLEWFLFWRKLEFQLQHGFQLFHFVHRFWNRFSFRSQMTFYAVCNLLQFTV